MGTNEAFSPKYIRDETKEREAKKALSEKKVAAIKEAALDAALEIASKITFNETTKKWEGIASNKIIEKLKILVDEKRKENPSWRPTKGWISSTLRQEIEKEIIAFFIEEIPENLENKKGKGLENTKDIFLNSMPDLIRNSMKEVAEKLKPAMIVIYENDIAKI